MDITIYIPVNNRDYRVKILFISDVYFPRVNGVSTSIRIFKKQLVKLGHQVHLIAPDYCEETQKKEDWITRVPSRKIYFDPEDRLMKFFKAKKLVSWIKEEKFDLIHIHTPFIAHYLGIKISKELSIPCVETYHTFFEDYLHHYLPIIPEYFSRRYAKWISKRQCNSVDGIISPSKPMLNILREYQIDTLAEVIPTGLENKYLVQHSGHAFRIANNIPLRQKVLLFVGRIAHEKNILFLLHMHKILLQKHPNTLLLITGEGPAEADIKKEIKKLEIDNNVKMIGYLDQINELPACYASADVFVFSSKSETQGIVLLEAMAQGTPVVGIAELGAASILFEGEGALIAKDDTQHFSERVNEILSDREIHRKLSEKAIAYVKRKWTASEQANKLSNFYKVVKKQHERSIKPLKFIEI